MLIDVQEKQFTTSKNVTINYAEVPSNGTPLVLLHGGSARWQNFESIIPDFAKKYHVYAPDLRGHGNSSWTPGHYLFTDFRDDIIEFLKQVVGRPAYMFGHSLGGMIGLMVAAKYADGVRALAVGDSPLTNWSKGMKNGGPDLIAWRDMSGGKLSVEEIMEKLKNVLISVSGSDKKMRQRDVYGEDHPVFPYLAHCLYHHDPEVLTVFMDQPEKIEAGYAMGIFPTIPCPVLLLQADPATGGAMNDAEVEKVLPFLKKGSHVKLKGVSHVLHNEKKELVLEALNKFFNAR